MGIEFYSEKLKLSLGIAGYEFPENEEDVHDQNWLNVTAQYTQIENDRLLKTIVDPCLLSWELVQVRDCFRLAQCSERRLEFMEPEIEFLFLPNGMVNIEMRYGMRFGTSGCEVYSAGPFTSQERELYVAELSRLCNLYPVKGHQLH